MHTVGEPIVASATSLAGTIRTGDISSEAVVEAHLRRIVEVNPSLNAVVQVAAPSARAAARAADAHLAVGARIGPLHGVPVTIKDIHDVAGLPCTAGTQGLAARVPATDATVVARLKAAGAIVLGMTNVPELALACESDNLVYGRTNNPYDLARTPGGSSGGEAAIIAAGGSPLGIGSDAAGSIRLPAHFCGIAGIKPTTGRVPKTGYLGTSAGALNPLVQSGPMARYVEDLELALPIICGADGRDPTVVDMPLGDARAVDLKRLRVAFHVDNGIVSPTPATVETVQRAARSLADAGMAVEEARPGGIEQSYELTFDLLGVDGGIGLRSRLQSLGTTEAHPLMREFLELLRPRTRTTTELLALLVRLDLFRAEMFAFWQRYDAILCPACAVPAMLHGTSWANATAFSYTMAYNLTGWPSAVVRAGTSPEGLPIGVQIVARPWREDVALAVARHLEQTMGGWQPARWPDARSQAGERPAFYGVSPAGD
jgi:amidase